MTDQSRSFAWPEFAIGVGLLAFSGLVWWQTATMAVSPMYAKVGPTVFPYMTAAGLAALAVFLIGFSLRGGWQPQDEKEVPVDWKPVLVIVAGLVLNVGLIGTLGFTLASTILFVLVTWGFGSRNPLRDGAIGFAFAVVSYFGFAKASGSTSAAAGSNACWGLTDGCALVACRRLRRCAQPAKPPVVPAGHDAGHRHRRAPGLGPALTIALLLPITFKVDPTAAFILFAGIYYGAMYGGSTTSILLNTPGESATIVTALEGNKMARSGRGGAALSTAAIGSFVAGTIARLASPSSRPSWWTSR